MPVSAHRLSRIAGVTGVLVLVAAYASWFPPSTWRRIPFSGDWPPLFQSTIDAVALLGRAAFSGWRWEFLGGYPLVRDGAHGVAVWAAVPALLLGPAAGVHLALFLLLAAIPALVWAAVRIHSPADRDAPWTAAGIAGILAAVSIHSLVRSGEMHALAGAVAAFAALVAARACRTDALRPAAAVVLVVALTLTTFGQPAMFLVALLFLVVDAVVAQDAVSGVRVFVAVLAAGMAGLPVTWDLWRAPWSALANLPAWHPARDAASLLPMLAAPLLSWAIHRRPRFRLAALLALALVVLKSGVTFAPVPHVRTAADAEPGLAARLSALDGDLVMVESTFEAGAPFPAHFEALLPAATGKRFYGGMWRDARPIVSSSPGDLDRDFERWGMRHLVVWSLPAMRYLDPNPLFQLADENSRWHHYAYARPPLDPGPGRLVRSDPLGGTVRVAGAQRGEVVTVRTNYDPAWHARMGTQAVSVFDLDGQLAFAAPRDGAYDVELLYPRRLWLLPSSIAAIILGALIIRMLL